MEEAELRAVADWSVAKGLKGLSETALLDGFCDRLRAAGCRLERALPRLYLET